LEAVTLVNVPLGGGGGGSGEVTASVAAVGGGVPGGVLTATRDMAPVAAAAGLPLVEAARGGAGGVAVVGGARPAVRPRSRGRSRGWGGGRGGAACWSR